MSEARTKGRFRRYAYVIYRAVRRNLSRVVSVSTLAIGGLTLLTYALSIGQLPEFTWNDLTGTVLAVCATGVLVAAVVVAYCLSAGYFARSALEAVYPEAAHLKPASPSDANAPVEPYARLVRGPFILGATCFSVLACVGLLISISNEKLVSPYNGRLVGALIVALIALVIVLLTDWRRFRRQWARYTCLSIFGGAVVMLTVMIIAWWVGPDKLAMKSSAGLPWSSATIDWASASVTALDHAIAIGISGAVVVAVLFGRRMIAVYACRVARWLIGLIPWKWPGWLVHTLTWTSHVVVGEVPDRRFIKAKIYVTAVFCLFSIVVFAMAYMVASMGNAHSRNVNLFFIVVLLTVLNWASFSVRDWRGRAALGLMTAALVFLSYPLMARNPVMFPKMIVSLLGLGNERLATVALSSKQCATLAPYGVSCVTDNEKAITLTNVNMLNRLGSSMVLELLIKDDGADASAITAMSTSAGNAAKSAGRGQPVAQGATSLVATSQMRANSPSAKFCDSVLLSQLDSTDAIHAVSLRCVELVVPKDQVFGYTKSNWRSYRGEYTAYRPGTAKEVMAVKVSGDAG